MHTDPASQPAPVALDVMLDLDGCFFLFDAMWFEAAVKLGHLKEAHAFEEAAEGRHRYLPANRWEFYEEYGVDLDRFLAICHEAADAGLLWNGPMMPGSRTAWDELADAGHRIHVKTDRPFGVHPVASQVGTIMTLAQNRVRYDSITFTADKTDGPPCHIALEDKLSNYDALAAAGVEVWLIDRPWNQDDGSRRRVYAHDEFVRRVRAAAERRAATREPVGA